MRCMNRNKSVFYYALYERAENITDEYGNTTGEHELIYGPPQKYRANISAARGEADTREFGVNENYDKVIVMDIDAPKIDEYSVLWVDTMPVIKDDGTTDTPYDYIVKKVAKSLNSISIAICKVDVGE